MADAEIIQFPGGTPPEVETVEEPVECSLGIDAARGRVALRVDTGVLYLTADQADEMAVDLRTYAIELRNGGRG